jgi:hypothetical protein
MECPLAVNAESVGIYEGPRVRELFELSVLAV